MSFSFRDRPTLRDRLRGKSGDEIMEELKQSLDQDRKKFFESRPNWKQSPASSAFSKVSNVNFNKNCHLEVFGIVIFQNCL